MTNPPYMLEHLSSIANFLNHPRVFSFIHIPVQAGHDNTLERMNREHTVDEFKRVADYFIEKVPGITIATDIICGFAECT
jgi:threonylcarbamoyladenosine tRNA methylthiotransferase CDKAL1